MYETVTVRFLSLFLFKIGWPPDYANTTRNCKNHLILQLPRSCRVWLRKNKKDRTVPLKLLYSLQKARIRRRFDKLAKELQRKARWCHHYFFKRDELPVESWAHYAFLEEGLSTYGHKTSNIIKPMNGAWKPFRALHPYWLLDKTVEWCHNKYAERGAAAHERKREGHLFTKYAQDLIDRQRQLARNRKYKISSGRDVFYCTDETKRNGTRYSVSQMCSC